MKKLLFLLSITVISCTVKEEHINETSNYTEAINHIYHTNSSKVRMIEKSISDNGYKNDTVLLKAAIELLNNSDEAIHNKKSLDKHFNYLLEKYSLLERKDTARLKRADRFLEKFNQDKDSSDYYNYLLTAMLLESDVIDFYCEQVGAYRITLYTMIFKESDTTKINDLYTFIIFPADYRYTYSEVIVDSLVEITVDDKKVTTPIHFKQTGGAITATLTPTQKGKYHIKGMISVIQKASRYKTEDVYSTSFIVE